MSERVELELLRRLEAMTVEREEALVFIETLRSALSSIANQYYWEYSPGGNLAREALGKGRKP